MPSQQWVQYLERQRKSRKKAARIANNKRDQVNRKRKRERKRFRAFREDMDELLAQNSEPIPPDTEVIDERTSSANRDPRLRRNRAFGMLSTMGRSSYLGGGPSPMGGVG